MESFGSAFVKEVIPNHLNSQIRIVPTEANIQPSPRASTVAFISLITRMMSGGAQNVNVWVGSVPS
jgi:hypothetical protein